LLESNSTSADVREDDGSGVPPPHQPGAKSGAQRSLRADRSHRER
jgi:hypothetical protein